MTPGRRVLDAIDDALVIRERHPALFARLARAGASCAEIAPAFDAYLAGISTHWWFTGDGASGANRKRRRAEGKRRRQARRTQRLKARR